MPTLDVDVIYCYIHGNSTVTYKQISGGYSGAYASSHPGPFDSFYTAQPFSAVITPVDGLTAVRMGLISEHDLELEAADGVLPATFQAALQLALKAKEIT